MKITGSRVILLLVLTGCFLATPLLVRSQNKNTHSAQAIDLGEIAAVDKASGARARLDAKLNRIVEAWEAGQRGEISLGESRATIDAILSIDSLPSYPGAVEVWIRYGKESEINPAALLSLGATNDDHYAVVANFVQTLIPIASIIDVAELPGVVEVSVPPRGYPDVVSEGVARVSAQNFTAIGFKGQGIKVAVLDGGFSGYSGLLGTELPSSVTIKSFFNSTSGAGDITGGGQKHGTACAENVYDMAPGAQLYLVNYNSLAEMSAAVDYLISQNVRIISHSIAWFNQSFYNGQGPVSDIVTRAAANGILWTNSAGNSAGQHWEGFFADADNDKWNDFSSGDETIEFTLSAGQTVSILLTWDDWTFSTNDYDLFLFLGSQQVASSIGPQFGFQTPTESIGFVAPQSGTYSIGIRRPFSANILKFELFVFSSNGPLSLLDHNVQSSSIPDPAASPNSLTVGAMRFDQNTIESYSSRGPTTAGVRKPDITGPDCGLTLSSGGFCGTSSSAPHTAGAAALVWSQSPTKIASQVQATLLSSAIDFGSSGPDNTYGWGMLSLPLAGPVLTSSISLNSPGPYFVGQTVTGTFSITNQGGTAFTFGAITIGGRLNGDSIVRDFPLHGITTLNPGQTYTYQDSFTFSESGSYKFFPAYRTIEGVWRIGLLHEIPKAGGIIDLINLTVNSVCNPPAPFSLSSPSNGQSLSPTTSAILSWGASASANSYDVYFGTSSNPPFLANQTGLSRSVTVSPGQNYFWKVVARVNCSSSLTFTAGIWSFSVQQNCNAPGSFSLSSPSNGQSLGPTTSTTLAWGASANANSYDVYFGTSSNPSFLANQTGLSRSVTVSPGQSYFWKVVARVNCSSSLTFTAGIWSFSVQSGTLPDLVVTSLTAPTIGSIGGQITVSTTIVNQGSASAGAFRVGFYFSTNNVITTSDTFTGWSCTYPGGLASGGSTQCNGPIGVPSSLSPGTYFFGVIVDDLGQIAEINEANNARSADTGPIGLTGGHAGKAKSDIDGDGKSDIGFYRNGVWSFLQSAQNYSFCCPRFFSWGGAGVPPILADFDGDSRADLAYIVPPSGGQSAAYAILKSTANYDFSQALFVPAGFPSLGDTPVVGDFDGDGKADPGIWRSSQGIWIIPLSSMNYSSFVFTQWGQAGDIALPNGLNLQ